MIVILTALQVEYHAVSAHLVDVKVRRHPAGTLFDIGTLASRRDRQIALAATGTGNLTAAALTERAIVEFKPAAVMFVGVAGGLRDWLDIGDVVVATKVYAYHGGRSEDEEFLVRPRTWEMSHAIEQVARRLPRSNGWQALLPPEGGAATPAVHFEAIATGDVVLNSAVSPLRQQIKRNYNDAVAIEMESAGFALAGHLNGNVPMAAIRAVSDLADGSKAATDCDGGQRIAARNAAAFAVALAADLEDERYDRRDGEDAAPDLRPVLPRIRNSNIARDNARVGQQIGINLGNLRAVKPRIGEDG